MVPQIKKILYATDLTKNSKYVFHYAIDLARKHDATITILHCIEEIPLSVYARVAYLDSAKMLRENKNQEKKQNIVKINGGVAPILPKGGIRDWLALRQSCIRGHC